MAGDRAVANGWRRDGRRGDVGRHPAVGTPQCRRRGRALGLPLLRRGLRTVDLSPQWQGRLCPKGAATQELLTHDGRATRVKYRAPHASAWTEIALETAMEMVAARVWDSRERFFEEARDHEGRSLPLMQCPSIAHLGGATLENEENYLIKKLFTGGLGIVAISNQARI